MQEKTNTAIEALNFAEETGGIPVEDRIGRADLVTNTLKYLVAILSKGSPEARKAPILCVTILAALEFYVIDTTKIPLRDGIVVVHPRPYLGSDEI